VSPAAPSPIHEIQIGEGFPLGSTHELAVGPDGAVWVTQQDQSRLVRITFDSEPSYFPLAPGLGPHGLAFAAGGHMWLTLQFVNEIAQVAIEPKFEILQTYPIRVPAAPHGLTIANDGSVWWTGKYGGVIGRLDPSSGDMQIFPLPDRYSQPIYIRHDVDPQGSGAIYFTELTHNAIGSITADGTITEYQLPPGLSRPIAVAIRDGQVWFTAESGHFGVLDPSSGRFNVFPIPTSNPPSELASLAFDANGTLWLEINGPNGACAIGRVDSGMNVILFPVPTPKTMLHRIILGPKQSMWFTEMATDTVGWISTSPEALAGVSAG